MAVGNNEIIIDSHLDLAANAISFDRDLTEGLAALNKREKQMDDHPARSGATATFPEMRRGQIVLAFGTLLARSNPNFRPAHGFKRVDIDHATPAIAAAVSWGQLAYYEIMADAGELSLILDKKSLSTFWERQVKGGNAASGKANPIGIVLSMEGGDPITGPEKAELWWDAGLRIISVVHYGRSPYASGTGTTGPVTEPGKQLLKAFASLGMMLDVSHLCDQSFFQALELFPGPVLATHNNCRALVPGDRQFSDEQIRLLISRNAVIGVAADGWMLYPKWVRGTTKTDVISIDTMVDHIDHICSLAGNSKHAAIGSDLDGGFGTEQTPGDLKSIADLQKIGRLLEKRGYAETDIRAILHKNWYEFLSQNLPEEI
ncbi:MAG: peptidase [Spirochaetales bacterium]|nr:peptidase [Spirochaetales bacterium]